MIKINSYNPKLNNKFITGKGIDNKLSTNKITFPKNNKSKKNKYKKQNLPIEQQVFLNSLINNKGKGFKKL